jgi:hypothetical protein
MKNTDIVRNADLNLLLDSLAKARDGSRYWDPALTKLLGRAYSEFVVLRAECLDLKSGFTFVEKPPVANSSLFKGPLTAKSFEFSRGLESRIRGLTCEIEQVLASASVNGLYCKNVVVRLQAEADATKVIAAAIKDFGFSTVNVQLVYFRGGDFYAAVTVPSGADGDYCRAVQELTGSKLRCVPA